jgi:uncharacterized membrane protein YoaK (UPF0700 family)
LAKVKAMTYSAPTNERIRTALASCVVLAVGYLDGYGLLVLGTYVSFMSGNSTMTGVSAGQGNWAAALTPAIAIVGFVAGSAAGSVVINFRRHRAPRLVFLLVAALLLTVALVGSLGGLKNVDVALLGLAMGMVTPISPKIGMEPVTLTFMTGTLSRIGSHLGLAVIGAPVPGSEGAWDTHLHRARIGAQLWASFLVGVALSGLAMSVARDIALWPGIAAMLLIAWASSYAETRDAEKSPPTAGGDKPTWSGTSCAPRCQRTLD